MEKHGVLLKALRGTVVRYDPDIPIDMGWKLALPTRKIKTLGSWGPKYEVGLATRKLEDGDWMVEITMVETGEKFEHRLSQIMEDPDA